MATFPAQHLSRIARRIKPLSVADSIVIPANTLLTDASIDVLELCVMPAYTMLAHVAIQFPILDTGTELLFTLAAGVGWTFAAAIDFAQTGVSTRLFTTADLTDIGIVFTTPQMLQLFVTTAADGAPVIAKTVKFAVIFAPTKA